KLAFDVVRRMPFNQRLRIVRKAVGNELHIPEVQELQDACRLAEDVAKWRNKRIRGEVRFINENQPVILDEQGKPLQIDYHTCVEKIREAIHAGIAMQASVPHLVAYEMDLRDLMGEQA